MSSPTAFAAIENRLRALWSATPLVFENDDFDLPGTPAHFVYVEVFGDLLTQDTFGAPGANVWIETGQIYLHVMTPRGIGSAKARELAHGLANLFREQPFDGVYPRDMSVGQGEPARSFGNYFPMTLSVTFERRDITSIP